MMCVCAQWNNCGALLGTGNRIMHSIYIYDSAMCVKNLEIQEFIVFFCWNNYHHQNDPKKESI